jgi:1,2-diacylglycerol 3-alpha-glucosyltransferase
MRIGFFTDRYLPQTDGIVYSIETFRTELEALGHEVYVIAPAPGLRYKEVHKHVVRFPAVKGLFFEDYLTSLFFPPQATRRLDKLKLDVIHYHTPSPLGLLGAYYAIRNNIPLVTTYHTDLFEYVKHYPSVLPGTIALSLLAPVVTGGGLPEYRTSLSSIKPERDIDRWNQKIVERGVTLVHNHCDAVITPSLKMEHQLQSWKTKSKIVTLPTGVEKITTTSRDIAAVRHKYGLGPSDEVVLFVGRIGGEKNVELLLAAFNIVAAKRPNSKLILAGEGPDRKELMDRLSKTPLRDRVIFTGHIPRGQLGALYAVSSLFAFPSMADTQGLVVNEAACAGLPIVMVDHEVAEVVHNHQNGLFARNNPRDFAAKIIAILKDPKRHEAMSRRSVELGQEFTPGKQAAKLLRLYQEVIARHHEQPKSQLAARFEQFWRRRDS